MPSQKVVRFYVLKTVFLKNQVIQDMVLCHLVWFGWASTSWYFEASVCVHFQGQEALHALVPEIEGTTKLQIFLNIHPMTKQHILETWSSKIKVNVLKDTWNAINNKTIEALQINEKFTFYIKKYTCCYKSFLSVVL